MKPAAPPGQFIYEQEEFGFYLPGDWRVVPSGAGHLLQIQSDANESLITLSIMTVQTPEDGLHARADDLVRMRREAHEAWFTLPENLNKSRDFKMSDAQKRHFADLKSIEVSYTGQYPGYTMFGFVGFVTPRKIVSMLCETKYSFAPGRAGVFHTVAHGFRNKLP